MDPGSLHPPPPVAADRGETAEANRVKSKNKYHTTPMFYVLLCHGLHMPQTFQNQYFRVLLAWPLGFWRELTKVLGTPAVPKNVFTCQYVNTRMSCYNVKISKKEVLFKVWKLGGLGGDGKLF